MFHVLADKPFATSISGYLIPWLLVVFSAVVGFYGRRAIKRNDDLHGKLTNLTTNVAQLTTQVGIVVGEQRDHEKMLTELHTTSVQLNTVVTAHLQNAATELSRIDQRFRDQHP